MISISVICVGKLKEKYLKNGCEEYLKRLSAFAKTQIIEIPEERCGDDPSLAEIETVIEKEGERIAGKIPKGAAVIPLCIEGKELRSDEIASEIEKISLANSKIAFVIGGSFGLSEKIKELSRVRLSFGRITLPHQLARLVLLEQIYRAFSILNHSRYHK